MGYYTDYELTVQGYTKENGNITITNSIPANVLSEIDAEIKKMDVFEDAWGDDSYYGNAKWYDWEDDMRLISKRFPNILFSLHGDGESPDDFWYAYFIDGAEQYCPGTIVYDDFNPNAMSTTDIGDYSKLKYSYEC